MFLKVERQRRGWSQAELARRARMSAATVSQIESGRMRPYDSQLRKLRRALGLPRGQERTLVEEAPQTGATTGAT